MPGCLSYVIAANPVTAGAVPQLRTQLATARRTIASTGSH
jgi:hypothetical protein